MPARPQLPGSLLCRPTPSRRAPGSFGELLFGPFRLAAAEHSLEVQLPFLQVVRPDVEIVAVDRDLDLHLREP